MHQTRIFKTPDDLLAAWNGYKENLKEQGKEWMKVQYVGKDGERKEDPQKVPMTLEGFKRYCRENHGEVGDYFKNTDKMYNDFSPICLRIKEEIRENQITGGLLGFYNPSITQRLNGLVEKVQEDGTKEVTIRVKYEPRDNNNAESASSGARTDTP